MSGYCKCLKFKSDEKKEINKKRIKGKAEN